MSFTRTLNKFGVPVYSTGGEPGKIGILQPKPKYRFRVRMVGFGNNTDQEDLTRQVVNVGRPSLTHESVPVDSYNSKAYYAGKHTWNPISLSLRDDITNKASKLVSNQLQKQLNHFEQTGPVAAINYKFDMFIETLDGGNTGILDQWFVEGCWLTSVEYGDLDYSDSSPVLVNMQIQFDNAQHWGAAGTEELMMNPAPINNDIRDAAVSLISGGPAVL